MTDYVFAPPALVSVPVAGGGLFPVHRVYCVGRNYADHAREMGHDPNAEPPFFFSKPPSALVTGGAPIPYPPRTADFHYEMELVIAIGTGGADIDPADAERHIFGYAAGLDMTRRDLQAQAKKLGRPWEVAKGFDLSGPIGDIVPAARVPNPLRGRIALTVNGAERQVSDIGEMIWDVPHVVAELSTLFRLVPGDLIFTGTPAGVGAVVRGDRLRGEIAGIGTVETAIA
jgi:fumarylpyruvate hydrolase